MTAKISFISSHKDYLRFDEKLFLELKTWRAATAAMRRIFKLKTEINPAEKYLLEDRNPIMYLKKKVLERCSIPMVILLFGSLLSGA